MKYKITVQKLLETDDKSYPTTEDIYEQIMESADDPTGRVIKAVNLFTV